MKPNITKNNNAYTMMELIIIMVILAISMSLVIPSFKRPGNIKTVARRVIMMASNLRTMAVRDQDTQKLHFSKNKFSPEFGAASKEKLLEDEDDNEFEKQEFEMTENMDYKTRAIELPESVELMDVEYRNGDTSTEGTINFYKNAYADNVAIHLQNDDDEIITLVVEPFLSKVRFYEEYVSVSE